MSIKQATSHNEIISIVNSEAASVSYPVGTDGMSFAEAAQSMQDAQDDLEGFAEACYDQYSTEELIDALKNGADKTDSKQWNLDEDEWEEAIKQALLAKQGDHLIDLLNDAESKWFELAE